MEKKCQVWRKAWCVQHLLPSLPNSVISNQSTETQPLCMRLTLFLLFWLHHPHPAERSNCPYSEVGGWDCYQGNRLSLTEIWKPKPSWRWEIWVSSPRKHLKTRCNLAATKTQLTLNSLPFVNPSFIFFIYFLITLFFGYMGLKEIAMNPPERQHPKGTQRYIFGFRTITLLYSGEESPTCAPS